MSVMGRGRGRSRGRGHGQGLGLADSRSSKIAAGLRDLRDETLLFRPTVTLLTSHRKRLF